MKTFKHIVLALTALLLVASCAIDEMWEGVDTQDEEKVLTFRPKFEDFESVTKAIGDASKVDKLLVQAFADGQSVPEYSKTYDISVGSKIENIKIPFFYSRTYNVYFWAYNSECEVYSYETDADGDILLNKEIKVDYPNAPLAYNSLEDLDAFYSVQSVNLSDNIPEQTSIKLTRPFAQVNLVADKGELLKAQANMVEFTINVAKTFSLASPISDDTTEKTFTFTSADYFQNTEEINGNVYLGTTYLFVPSSGKVTGKVKLYAGNNVLKSAENIEIPLAGNKRTNLVFSGFQVTVPDWDSSKEILPGVSDGWITITEPEQLAALLMAGTTEGTKVKIGSTLNMEKMPQDVKDAIAGKSFNALTLDGNNLTIKNFASPAFFANATNLTVSNLTLENVNITAATHVGVMVNELKGNGAFENVTVSGSSATTTNGAAGGFVGRSIRTSEKERSETLALTFTGCRIEGTDDKNIVATGSLAEGKFVGLFSGYDNGEKLVFTDCTSENAIVADYNSRYVEGNEGAWLAGNNYSAYNGFLGDETYLRGKVYFGGENEATNRFCPKWDGTTNTTNLDIEPLLANATYDAGTTAGTNRFVVYSAFDLAGVRKKTASPAAIYLMTDVDLFGQGEDGIYNIHSNFTKSKQSSADDNLFQPFNSIAYLEGNNNCIYNCGMSTVGTSSYQSAFIISGENNHTHQNIKFDNCCTVVPHVVITNSNGTKEDKSYGATFILSVYGTNYKMNNVHVVKSKVFGIQKTGVLAGRVLSSGGATISNCSVDNCYVENYECKDNLEKFTDSSGKVSADFYSYGEIGGLIGFVQYKATITGCSVSNTTVHAYGQDDKAASLSGYSVPVYIQGRNVNEFIGDIRCMGNYTIEITNCSVSNNICSERNDVYTKSRKEYPIIGKAYYVGASVWLLFTTLKVGEDPGTLKVQNITNDGTKLFTSTTTVSLQSLIG